MLLISDLHLHSSRPDIREALVNFLRNRAVTASRLYVLGDLFEVWLGDDAADSLADEVAAEFHRLSDAGVQLTLMHGNRDFLLGTEFAARCGACLVEEPLVIEVADRRIALLHGDVLCTRDVEYLKFRSLVRNPDWRAQFLARPLAERQEFARQARQQSKQMTSTNAAEIMDVTDSAVRQLFQQLQVDTIIHGHTHRPAVHELDLEQSAATGRHVRRVVLGDWDKFGWYGEIDELGAVSLHRFALDSA